MYLRLVDMLGRVVVERSKIASNGTYYLGGQYRPGVYQVLVQQGVQGQALKLVKQPN